MTGNKYFIGLDIGGTNTRGILYDGKKIIKSREVKTPQNENSFAKKIREIIAELSRGKNIASIGIGSAGVVENTALLFSPNIPAVKNFDFRKIAPSGVSLKVDNDARCFARGEYRFGVGKKFKSIFIITIGTGIGRAYVKNGKVQNIKKLEYPEKWEKEYQYIRDRGSDAELIILLADKLADLIISYRPEAVILGWGVISRKNLFVKLKNAIKKNGMNAPILKSSLGKHSAALGAALLFSR